MSFPTVLSSTSLTTNTGYTISGISNEFQLASVANVGFYNGRKMVLLGAAESGSGGTAYVFPLRNVESALNLNSKNVIKIVTGRKFDSFGSSVATGPIRGDETFAIIGAEFSPGGTPTGQTYAIPLSEIFKSNGTLDISQLPFSSYLKFVGDNTNSPTSRNGHSTSFMINENQVPSLIMGEQQRTTVIRGGTWLKEQTTIQLKSLDDPQKIQVFFNPDPNLNSGNIVLAGDLGAGHPGIIMSTINGTFYIPNTPADTPIDLATFNGPLLRINTQGQIALGDVNNDLKTDLIIANEKGQVYVIFGGDHLKNGTINVKELQPETGFMLSFPNTNPKSVATFQYSGNGDDLVVGDSANDVAYIYYANPQISVLNGTNPAAEKNNNLTFYGVPKTGSTVQGLDGALFVAGPNEAYILYTPNFVNTPEGYNPSMPSGNSNPTSSASKLSSPLSFLKTTFNIAGIILGKLFNQYHLLETQRTLLQENHLTTDPHTQQIPINAELKNVIASEFAQQYRVSSTSVLEIIKNQDMHVTCDLQSHDCCVQLNETTQELLNRLVKETRRQEALTLETNPNFTQVVHSALILGNFALELWKKYKSKDQNTKHSLPSLPFERKEAWKSQYLPLLEALEKDLLANNRLNDELKFYIDETKDRFESLESKEDLKDALFTLNYLRTL